MDLEHIANIVEILGVVFRFSARIWLYWSLGPLLIWIESLRYLTDRSLGITTICLGSSFFKVESRSPFSLLISIWELEAVRFRLESILDLDQAYVLVFSVSRGRALIASGPGMFVL